MFEKEAEEYQTEKRKSFNEHEQLCWGDVYKDWKNGAEFGYNKANEWHYVKDGDLPKNNTQILVLLENKRMKISIFMENKFTVWNKEYNTYTKLYNIIAWKEIVLPKEGEQKWQKGKLR